MFQRKVKPSTGFLVLAIILVLAIVAPVLAQIMSADPQMRFRETDQALPAGLWRLRLNSDVFSLERNTSATGNFATGTTVASFNTSGDLTMVGKALLPNGTAAAPTLSFSSDTDTGLYRIGAGIIGWATDGVERMRLTSTGLNARTSISTGLSPAQTGGIRLSFGDWITSRDLTNGVDIDMFALSGTYTIGVGASLTPYNLATSTLGVANNGWKNLFMTQGVLAGDSSPFIDHTTTWNNSGRVFVGFISNTTDTASDAASLLFDWQVGGSSRLKLRKDGLLTSAAGFAGTSATLSGLTPNSFIYPGTAGLLSNTAAATDGQILIGRTGLAPVAATITGTANQVIVTNGAGSITLSTPQDLGTGSSPTHTALTLSGLTPNAFMYPTTAGLVASTGAATNGQLLIGRTGLTPVAATLTGTANQVVVTNTAGTITLSTPQNIAATSRPDFVGTTYAQGTLAGASTPFISHTATWNNAGTVFTNILSNVTNTASSASSLLLDLQVGGASKFSVSRTGVVNLIWATMAAGGTYEFASSTRLKASADGILNLFNAGESGFTRLNFGGTSTLFPGIGSSGTALTVQLADGSAGGRLGVGTVPAATINFAVSGVAGQTNFALQNNTSGYTATDGFQMQYTTDTTALYTWAYEATNLYFGTTNAQRMAIGSDGRVSIGPTLPATSAILDVQSTTMGFLPPRMTTTQRDAIATPPAGLIIYNTSTNKLNVRTASAWEVMTSS